MSQITVCFGQFFSRRLFKQFKPKSPWKKWPAQHQLVLLGVLNSKFVPGLTGWVPARLPWSHLP